MFRSKISSRQDLVVLMRFSIKRHLTSPLSELLVVIPRLPGRLFLRRVRGGAVVEYAVMAALIAMAVYAGVLAISGGYNRTACGVSGVLNGSADNVGGSGSGNTTCPTSCKTILAANPSAASGVYTIYPQGSTLKVYCDMVGVNGDGGGWSLVMRGYSGDLASIANWENSASYPASLPSNPSPTQSSTLKFSDAVINAIRGTSGIYRLQGNGGVTATRYFGATPYEHMTTTGAQGAIAYKSYSTTALSGGQAGNPGECGLDDDDGGSGIYFSTNYGCLGSGTIYWYLGNGSGANCFTNATGGQSGTGVNACNFIMWVK